MKRVLVSLGLLLVVVAVLWVEHRRSAGVEQFEATGGTMGTAYTVKVVGRAFSDAEQEKIREVIVRELDGINGAMSRYQEGSEIDRFNRARDVEPRKVSPQLLLVVEEAEKISSITNGAFDMTVGPLVKAWGFDDKTAPARAPDPKVVEELRRYVGYRLLEVNGPEGTLRKAHPKLDLDLSAIAKGYGVDRLAEVLEERGYTNFLVEIGGEVRCKGVNRMGIHWQVAIEEPLDRARAIRHVVALKDRAMATSGDYRNFYYLDGKRISHTIDPRTGKPVEHDLASVSVVHRRCMVADAYATALSVMGPEEGFLLAEKQGLAALFIIRQEDGGFIDRASTAFSEYLAPAE